MTSKDKNILQQPDVKLAVAGCFAFLILFQLARGGKEENIEFKQRKNVERIASAGSFRSTSLCLSLSSLLRTFSISSLVNGLAGWPLALV
ncbi:CLUMA_CG003700, isoform A [Clunio marinus]|uniref:CLUMA_CG003700, isoform A n=1 Tax=Clunio marinus TaxID=568069 RepID=A0A1J1HRF2_9DIPT|nr:CLUMA_CG003700, isoform A [Clunio marinus]